MRSAKTGMRKSFRIMALTVIFLSLTLTACGGGSPTDAARGFFENAVRKDKKALDYLCKSVLPAGEGMASGVSAIIGGTAESSFDFGNITFTLTSESAQAAEVKLGGKLKVTVGDQSREVDLGITPLGAAPIKLIKEDGAWKVCS